MKRLMLLLPALLALLWPTQASAAIGDVLTAEQINQGGKTIVLHLPYGGTVSNRYFKSNADGTGFITLNATNAEQTLLNEKCYFAVESVDGGIVLRNLVTNKYISDATPTTATSNIADAAVFTALQNTGGIDSNFNTNTYEGSQAVRFRKNGTGNYLNSNGPQWYSGTGCWSVYIVHDFTGQENGHPCGVKYSTDTDWYFYTFKTPNRESRYPTAKGATKEIIGETEASNASAWKFVKRNDGMLDIINYDGTYISPVSAYNTALKTVPTQPNAGWALLNTGGYWFIYSGTTAQFNQTGSGLSYKVYNWGNQGTVNTSDPGCQYVIEEADMNAGPYAQYDINSGTGAFVNPSNTWNATWNSTASDPSYTFKVISGNGAANMKYTDGYIAIYTGKSLTACEYRLLAQDGYKVVGFSCTAHNTSDTQMTITLENGTVYTIAAGASVNIKYVDLNATTVSFTQASANKEIVLENFKVFINEVTADPNLPQAGKRYYIAAQTWDGTQWVEKFLNNKSGGTENCGTVLTEATVWLCEGTEGAWTFKSLTTNKYLCHGGARDAATCAITYPTQAGSNPPAGSLVVKSTTGNETRYMLIRQDGSNIQSGDKCGGEADFLPKNNNGGANTYTPYIKIYETTGLPEAGKVYYISALIDKNNNSNYSHYYIRNESGTTFAWPEVNDMDIANQWLCEDSSTEGKVFFKNVKTGKYLGHKTLQDNGLAFTVTDQSSKYNGYACLTSSASTSSYLVVRETSGWDQAQGLFDPHTTNYSTYYRFEDVAKMAATKASLTINTNMPTGAVIQNNGTDLTTNVITFTRGNADITLSVKDGSYDTSIYTFEGFFDANGTPLGQTYTVPTATSIDLIITARFTYNIISAAYGDKWLRLYNVNDNNHYATLYDEGSEKRAKTQTLDFSMQEQLWCFVGDTEGFRVYNMATGNTMVMTIDAATAAENGTFQMQPVSETNASKQLWKVELANGNFCIVSSSLAGQGWNPHGGMGNQLKFWRTSGTGTQWLISSAPSEPKTLNITFNENELASSNNTKLGALTIVSEGKTGTTPYTFSDFANSATLVSNMYINSGTIAYNASGDNYDGYTVTLNGTALGATAVELGDENNVEFHVDTNSKTVYVYYNGDNSGNKPFRIPALGTFPDGTLLAVTDMRTCGNDIGFGRVDLWCKTSTDNGRNWGENQVIVEGNGATSGDDDWKCGFGDAALCIDGNDILLMCVGGHAVYSGGSATNRNAMVRIRGTYDPTTKTISWDEPENQTQQFFDLMPENAYTMFIGSGRLFQSRVTRAEGAEHNRVYAALLAKNNGNIVVYSDDFGATWHILGSNSDRPAPNGDEPKCEELPDGSVILSSRKGGGRYFNIFTYSDVAAGAGTWGDVVSSNNVSGGLSWGGNSTNGDIFFTTVSHPIYPDVQHHYMLQSCPTGSGRSDVKVFRKRIDPNVTYTPTTFSQGWEVAAVVSTKSSCYSALTRLNDNSYGVFYEEVPGGYCMIYKNYSEAEMLGEQDWSSDIIAPEVTFRQPTNKNLEQGAEPDKKTYATIYSPFALSLDDGIEAYACSKVNDGSVILTAIEGGTLPSLTPAVLIGPELDNDTQIDITLPVITDRVVPAYDGTNLLYGTLEEKTAGAILEETGNTGKTVFGLTGAYGTIGFYKASNSSTLTAGRAYLILDANQAGNVAGVKGFTMTNGTTDAIDSTPAIETVESIYDLTGRRISRAKAGSLYIINGKKTVVK